MSSVIIQRNFISRHGCLSLDPLNGNDDIAMMKVKVIVDEEREDQGPARGHEVGVQDHVIVVLVHVNVKNTAVEDENTVM